MLPTVALQDIVTYLDALLTVHAFEEEEPANGLIVNAGRPVMRIAAAVNTSFTAIRGAAQAGAQLLLVHHAPWTANDGRLKVEKEQALLTAGISLYGAHAALDCAPEIGNADALAALIGLDVEGRFARWLGGQAGVYGRLDGDLDGLVAKLERALGVPVASWRNSERFGKVAVITGAGGHPRLLEEAQELGCDTYVTGEGTMNTKLFAREAGINLVLATHYATEAPGIRKLAERVVQHFRLPWAFIEEDPDVL